MVKYSEWKEESINLDEFRSEIVNKVLMYIDELVKINPSLMISKELKKLKCSIDVIKRTFKN
ncbi:hypothetical protein [Clostridium sp. SHJSY1]|uniref:hypothetical protein n=1 Tax=Clostridium sp. SHJSY1 TaxID=2942483 RepID=UPI00287B93EE|nr:hypothetical protein [Clostridium sp. SHJSY1]